MLGRLNVESLKIMRAVVIAIIVVPLLTPAKLETNSAHWSGSRLALKTFISKSVRTDSDNSHDSHMIFNHKNPEVFSGRVHYL